MAAGDFLFFLAESATPVQVLVMWPDAVHCLVFMFCDEYLHLEHEERKEFVYRMLDGNIFHESAIDHVYCHSWCDESLKIVIVWKSASLQEQYTENVREFVNAVNSLNQHGLQMSIQSAILST